MNYLTWVHLIDDAFLKTTSKQFQDIIYNHCLIAGLKSTLISTKEILNTSINDFTLCHGLAGITDVLYHGLYELGDKWTDDTEVPFLVAETGKDLYSKNNLPWPCGSLGVDFPGLFRGLAGIGYFSLRLYDPKIQSVLMLEPQKF